jgi:peptide chain release factor 1
MQPGQQKVILEIRAGTGGDEAALFAGDLARMYQRYAGKSGWSFSMLDSNENSLGGYKSLVAEINGIRAYDMMKSESGVHRVQRIPKTEKAGRVHTSTASVAVLEARQDIKININQGDLEITFFRCSGPGGQNVNKVETGVRILHKPTGVVVASQAGRSQSANREQAMSILQAKIYDAQQQAANASYAAERRNQIGTADRSEKIRTYNFPQDRITDHRIGKKWHDIESIMEGNLDPVFKAFAKQEQA